MIIRNKSKSNVVIKENEILNKSVASDIEEIDPEEADKILLANTIFSETVEEELEEDDGTNS